MLVSHETPVDMLDVSRYYNDYDYCLVHLLPENEKYKDFYIESVKLGRHVLLDNSIFELGEAYDNTKFAQWVVDLTPTEYIVPDVLEETNQTISSFESFTDSYKDLPGKKIGVVQGKTYEEIVECYKFLTDKVDKIAISFDYSFYLNSKEDNHNYKKFIVSELNIREDLIDNKWCDYAIGRIQLLNRLIGDGIFVEKPHHLLGCSVPWEFKAINNTLDSFYLKCIETIDTSNPIVAGILEHPYNINYGLCEKWSYKLVDFINHVPHIKQKQIIQNNVWMFKNFCR